MQTQWLRERFEEREGDRGTLVYIIGEMESIIINTMCRQTDRQQHGGNSEESSCPTCQKWVSPIFQEMEKVSQHKPALRFSDSLARKQEKVGKEAVWPPTPL